MQQMKKPIIELASRDDGNSFPAVSCDDQYGNLYHSENTQQHEQKHEQHHYYSRHKLFPPLSPPTSVSNPYYINEKVKLNTYHDATPKKSNQENRSPVLNNSNTVENAPPPSSDRENLSHHSSQRNKIWRENEPPDRPIRSDSWVSEAVVERSPPNHPYFFDARPILPRISFFLADIRDGIAMINLQMTYLVVSKHYSEHEIGLLFLAFSLSQFLFMPISGYIFDYNNGPKKINMVIYGAIVTSFLTLMTPFIAQDYGDNVGFIMVIKVIQGASTTLLPLGVGSISLGIVGAKGMTKQISNNKIMGHLGTAIIVSLGTITAYVLYDHPLDIGLMFIVSGVSCFMACYWLLSIIPSQVDTDAARALIIESPTMTKYEVHDRETGFLNDDLENEDDNEIDEEGSVGSQGSGNLETEYHLRGDDNRNGNMIHNDDDVEAAATAASSTCVDDDICGNGYIPPSIPLNPIQSMTSIGQSQYKNEWEVQLEKDAAALMQQQQSTVSKRFALKSILTTIADDASDNTSKAKTSLPFDMKKEPSYIFGFGLDKYGEALSCGVLEEKTTSSIKMLNKRFTEVEKMLSEKRRRALTPLSVLINPTLMLFTLIVFLFHLSNSAILPLVMQTLAVSDGYEDNFREGLLMSGLCIIIAQIFMAGFAKICGEYSPVWGRKGLFMLGLFSLPVRCFSLYFLTMELGNLSDPTSPSGMFLKALIIGTQFLDAVGAGITGTLYVLVTNDISGGTGRFSLMFGITTCSMCLGCTVSGYVGQELALFYGYPLAFRILGYISLFPLLLYWFFMPETLPDYARTKKRKLNGFSLRKGNDNESPSSMAPEPSSDRIRQTAGISRVELI